jgi:hypothetical protein
MTREQYDALKYDGFAMLYCTVCRSITDFTHDAHGEFFCTSCGNEPLISDTLAPA